MNAIEMRKRIKSWIALYLAAISLIVIPLYTKNGYIRLIYWKARTYLMLAIPAVILAIVVIAADWFSGKRGKTFGKTKDTINDVSALDQEAGKPNISLLLLALVGIWSLFSTFMSMNPRLSLMGTAGWSVGSLMTVVLLASTAIISQYLDFHPFMLLPVMAVNIYINAFAVMQAARMDPFGFLKSIDKKYFYSYMATIGQKNSYSGYLCLILPLFWGAFIACKERVTELIYGAFAALGFMGLIAADSDSAYAGIGVCTIFILLYIFRSEQYIKRSSILLVLYGLCLLTVRYLPVFAKKVKRFKGVSKVMIGRPVAEILIIGGILLYFFGWKLIRGKRGKYILIALEALIFIAFAAFAVHTATHFNDKWGTNRGWTWRVSWEQFLKFPLRKKLIGVGPEMLVTVYIEIKAASGRNVVSSHCEPLQVLLTQGLIGLGIYFAFWGHMVRQFFRNKLWRQNTAVFFFPLAAYWGQSLFCSVYPITAVVFSVMAGLYIGVSESRHAR